MLYDGLTGLITQNLNTLTKEKLVPEFPRATLDGRDTVEICQEGEAFIRAFREVWDDHESSMSKISDLVKYMVRSVGFLTITAQITTVIRIVYIPNQLEFRKSWIVDSSFFCLRLFVQLTLRSGPNWWLPSCD